MKQSYRYHICILLFVLTGGICSIPVHGQVSAWNKTRIVGKNVFNYHPDTDKRPSVKKDRSNLIVYSDRNGNQAYEDPYFQRKRKKENIGTPYYVIGEENGTYKLVEVKPDILGKPKVFYSFLLNKKRHFKDPAKVDYAGWIPVDNVLMNNHAYVDKKNNRPIKYRIGMTDLSRLFSLSRYFRGDTLSVYGEPFLKNRVDGGVLNGQIVYAYKYDKSKRSVLISDSPSLEDASRKILGWIPADLLAEVGQNRAFLTGIENVSDSILGVTHALDTFYIHETNLQSPVLFDYMGNRRDCHFPASENTEINIPLLVWNKQWNNLINIKGGNIHSGDIRRMEKENKLVNVHFLYFDSEQKQANIFCNTLQNMKLKFSPEVDYAFTATCVSPMGNRYSSLLSEFSEWLDFINNDSISYKSRYGDGAGLEAALKRILEDVSGAVFDKNLFIVLGSRQKLDLKDKLIAQIGRKSGGFLFVQTKRSYDTPYQDFILQAKSILDKLSKEYTNSTADYIVDDKLVKLELFRNMETEDANVYLFDVPDNSLSFGGILFPKGRGELQNTTLELALDSINSQIQTINHTLLTSLLFHESRLGTLRSRPTHDLREIFMRSELADSMRLERIDRNSISDVYFTKLSVPDSIMQRYKDGYLFSEAELENLLQNYRGLLPEFSGSLQKKEFRVLRKVYKKQRKNQNREFHRKVLRKNAVVADFFYYGTGIEVNEELFHELKARRLRTRKCRKNNFHVIYPATIEKLKTLEGMYLQGSYKTVTIAGNTYYFIPKHLLP